jgi:Tol biopolymer transport system component
MWIRADGAGAPQPLTQAESGPSQVPRIPHSISPNGRHIIFSQPVSVAIGNGANLFNLTIDLTDPDHPKAGTPEPLLKDPARIGGASISPDGRWMAYSSGPPGLAAPTEVVVRPFADGKFAGDGLWQVSAGGGGHPVWSPAGRKLLYMGPDSRIMAVDYFAQKDSFAPLKPRIWVDRQVGPSSFSGMPFYAGPQPFDVPPDGERIVTWQWDELPNGATLSFRGLPL